MYDIKRANGPLEFLFINGHHSFDGLRQDREAWTPLMADGGIIALHDSCSECYSPDR